MIDFTQISEVHIGNNEVIDISIGGVSVWSKVQGQPNDEIWYTSTDSQVVTPNNTNFGGATILSNTYTGGKGVIKFDQNVTQLGGSVFANCGTLETITIPGAVTSLETNAFSRASNLTSVVIPNSVTTIKTYAFYSNNQLTSILIPSSVTTFQNSAIYQCINVSNLEVDANNTAYDSRNNCNAIIDSTTNALVTGCKNTTIPNTVTSIETYAFYQCHGMSGMIIPNSVTSIGANAFARADLTSVTITGDMNYGNYAFAYSGLISATVGGSIGIHCFRECTNLTSVTFNSTTTSIGNNAFLNCRNLNSLTFESTTTVPTLGNSVFSGVASTGTVYGQPGLDYSTIMAALPSGWTLVIPQPNNQIWYTSTDDQVVTPYNSNVFGNATIVSNTYSNSLGIITFDTDLDTIGTLAFYNCTTLASITLPASITTINGNPFVGCSGLAAINVDANNTAYDSRNNCNAIIDSTTNALVTGCKNTTIPNTVTSIGANAFDHCTDLTSITLPNSVTAIGGNSFVSCTGLTAMTFPASVTSIDTAAFINCSNLASLTFESTTAVPTLGSGVFNGVASTGTVYGVIGVDYTTVMAALPSGWTLVIPQPNNQIWYTSTDDQVVTPYDSTAFGNATIVSNTYTNGLGVITFDQALTEIGNAFKGCTTLETVNIPDTVTSLSGGVANGSFYDCTALTDVTMPAGLTTIHYNSFRNTTITNVYYGGTLDQWAAIDNSPNGAHLYIGGNLVTDLSALTSNATYIGNRAFQGNTDITSPIIPDTVTSMGDAVFMNCTALTSFTLPSTITTLPQATFLGCTSLTTATVPSNITYIDMEAFRSCTGLTSVTMAGSLTDLQNYAFRGCTSLASITFSGSTVPTMYVDVFFNVASTGTVYGQAGLDYSTVMAALPSGWTLVQ